LLDRYGLEISGVHVGTTVGHLSEPATQARPEAGACLSGLERAHARLSRHGQPSSALGDALHAVYRYLEEVLRLQDDQTLALDIVRRPKWGPIHEFERDMRCKASLAPN